MTLCTAAERMNRFPIISNVPVHTETAVQCDTITANQNVFHIHASILKHDISQWAGQPSVTLQKSGLAKIQNLIIGYISIHKFEFN